MAPASCTVLIVEDDVDSRTMLTMAVELEGHQVVTATNGVEAFNMARSHRPALILLDLMMPKMTGEEFRAAQLANPDIRGIPVVVISAHDDAVRIARRMKSSACVTKPIDFDQLTRILRRHCR